MTAGPTTQDVLPFTDRLVSPEVVQSRAQAAREALWAVSHSDDGSPMLYTLVRDDENGWPVPNEDGLRIERAIREAGAAVAARASILAAEDLEAVRVKWAALGVHDAEDYREYLDREHAQATAALSEAWRTIRAMSQDEAASPEAMVEQAHTHEAARQRLIKVEDEQKRNARGEGEWDRDHHTVMSGAYLAAVAEQRPMGCPDEFVVHEDSQKKAVQRLRKALRFYPTEWIEHHNTASRDTHTESPLPLRVRTTTGRAWHTDRTTTDRERTEIVDRERLIGPDDPLPPGAVEKETVQAVEYARGLFMETRHPERMSDPVVSARRIIEPVETTVIESEAHAELLVDNKPFGCLEPGESTAIHEFGHRMETASGRELYRLQEVFLARRTMSTDGNRESLEPLHSGVKGKPPKDRWEYEERLGRLRSQKARREFEWVRGDHLANRYAGKQYTPGRKHGELFTMGMEGVFAGQSGGLVGRGGFRADPEHRDLILGMLVSL